MYFNYNFLLSTEISSQRLRIWGFASGSCSFNAWSLKHITFKMNRKSHLRAPWARSMLARNLVQQEQIVRTKDLGQKHPHLNGMWFVGDCFKPDWILGFCWSLALNVSQPHVCFGAIGSPAIDLDLFVSIRGWSACMCTCSGASEVISSWWNVVSIHQNPLCGLNWER